MVAKWFFITSLTGRYSSSPETKMEADLARLREVGSSDDFGLILKQICDSIATNDFWSITLVNDLATSSARSPSMFAYFASLALLDANVLFSDQKVAELLDTHTIEPRSSIERHHLFPKNHLGQLGYTSNTQKNQIANFALVEWGDNSQIADSGPSNYLPQFIGRFSSQQLERMYYWHALPDSWETMEYTDFLQKRREMIAGIVREAYKKLDHDQLEEKREEDIDIHSLIKSGESSAIEFKATLRRNLHTGENDPKMEFAVLKTIAGFLNSIGGGTLLIGVTDNGDAIGIEADSFTDEDKLNRHLNELIKSKIGPQYLMYIHTHFDDFEDTLVLAVECQPSRSPVYLKDGSEQRLYVRSIAATIELKGSEAQDFIEKRFH